MWNTVASGIPYTIVAQGAFSERMLSGNPDLHLKAKRYDIVGDIESHGR